MSIMDTSLINKLVCKYCSTVKSENKTDSDTVENNSSTASESVLKEIKEGIKKEKEMKNEVMEEPKEEKRIKKENDIKFKVLKGAKFKYGSKFKNGAPHWIVVHYTAMPGVGAEKCTQSFANTSKSVSTHFFCDSKEVYRVVDEQHVAWHVCGGQVEQPIKNKKLTNEQLVEYGDKPDWRYKLAAENHIRWIKEGADFTGNFDSFSVDICCIKGSTKTMSAKDQDWDFNPKAVVNAAKTVAYLCSKYNIDLNHVIRHGDATGKACLPVDKTEIFTPKGFVPLSKISKEDVVFQYNPETNMLEETNIISVVDPYTSVVCKNRGYEVTLNHRTLVKTQRGVVKTEPFENFLGKRCTLFTSCTNNNEGISLTNDEIRFLVQVQGDGSFSYEWNDSKTNRAYRGVRFHLKKERKIFNVSSLLDRLGYKYYLHKRKDGTISIGILGKEIKEFIDTWLSDKHFTSKLYKMSKDQFLVFLDELWKVDAGSTSNKLLYCTKEKENLDVVQGLCAMNNIRTHYYNLKNGCYMLSIARSNYSLSGTSEFYESVVSCIEVPSGYIMIRQNGNTFITGNCPRPFISLSGDKDPTLNDHHWEEFKQMVAEYI